MGLGRIGGQKSIRRGYIRGVRVRLEVDGPKDKRKHSVLINVPSCSASQHPSAFSLGRPEVVTAPFVAGFLDS